MYRRQRIMAALLAAVLTVLASASVRASEVTEQDIRAEPEAVGEEYAEKSASDVSAEGDGLSEESPVITEEQEVVEEAEDTEEDLSSTAAAAEPQETCDAKADADHVHVEEAGTSEEDASAEDDAQQAEPVEAAVMEEVKEPAPEDEVPSQTGVPDAGSTAPPAGVNGWKTEGGAKYYCVSGRKVTGIRTIGGKKYVFDEDGKLVRDSWATVGTKKVHTGRNGVLQTGWKTIGGKKYYLNAKKNGAAARGIVTIKGKKYYFTWKGVLRKSGKVQVGKNVYRIAKSGKLTKTGTKALKKGWRSEEGASFYYVKGRRTTGIRKIRKVKYLFDANGRLTRNGWVTIRKKAYHSDQKGRLQRGLTKVGKDYYYLGADGAMQTGMIRENGKDYYFDDDGKLVRGGYVEVNGVTYKTGEDGRATVHVHSWEDMTGAIHHPAQGSYIRVQTGTETVVDEEAWDEEIYDWMQFCDKCGYSCRTVDEMLDHIDSAHYLDFDVGYYDDYVVVDTVHHEAGTHEAPVYETRWVEERPAWDETVVVGRRCRVCGKINK